MNKYDRAEIKKIILTQLELLSSPCSPAEQLKLERLETALRRIGAKNFGQCFTCEKALPMERLRIAPESVICPDCLTVSG